MTMSKASCSMQLDALRAAGGHGAVVADALQALGHGLGVRRLVVDDQHANRRPLSAAPRLIASAVTMAADDTGSGGTRGQWRVPT